MKTHGLSPPRLTDDKTVALVSQLRGNVGDLRAVLHANLREPLVRFCWGYLGQMEEAEDAFQEVCVRVLESETVPEHFRPWVYKIARNHCLNLIRQRAAHGDGNILPSDSRLHKQLTGQLTRLVRDEMAARVADVFEQLDDIYREVLRLRYVEDLPRTEISAVLEIPESVVKSRLFEGLKMLRERATQLEKD
ncbi:MAG: RNA polymerase sigma factor [Planctomycetes bacterium]|nr:RNA polymerase sigma factor [Planctomycetota bacterium]MBI3833657.1 RNA polymerase sigma factor [Planctomycetota bacterium]